MRIEQMVLLGVTFMIVFGAVLGVMVLLRPNPLQRRLDQLSGSDAVDADAAAAEPRPHWVEKVASATRPLAKFSLPKDNWERSPLRTQFMNAGWRGASAPVVFFSAKTFLAVALPVFALIAAQSHLGQMSRNLVLLFVLLFAALGYYLPNVVLARRIASRKRAIFEGFPDALDLITVCIEAGLGLDAALMRVVQELHIAHKTLSEEFELLLLELRAGLPRDKALKNFAMRTGVEDIDTFASMLIQAERFGTSIGDALRVLADTLRTKRRYLAEEKAAKIALKLLFPLIFFIFPALLTVLMGPAMIQVYRVLLPTMHGA